MKQHLSCKRINRPRSLALLCLGLCTLSALTPRVAIAAASISLYQESYFNRTRPPAGQADYSFLTAALRYDSERGESALSSSLEMAGSVSIGDAKYHTVEIPEGYLQTADDKELSFSLGRRLQNWSELDKEWGLGVVQPMNRFDLLRATEQGLTGLFAVWNTAMVKATLFASPIYFPERGAPFEVEDGKFASQSPWFNQPPEALIFSSPDHLTPVRYQVDKPSIGSVIQQTSLGLIVSTNRVTSEGFDAHLSVVKKPRNQLALPVTGRIVLSDDGTNGEVVVKPEVEGHTVAAVDFGYMTEKLNARFSVLHEVPDAPAAPEGATFQRLEPVTFYSVSIGADLQKFLLHRWMPRLRLAYLQTQGGESRTEGPLAENGTLFGYRNLYQQAVRLSLATILFANANASLSQSMNWLEEVSEGGSVLSFDTQLELHQRWQLQLAVDILGSSRALESTSTFISRFRGNDRALARVSYLF